MLRSKINLRVTANAKDLSLKAKDFLSPQPRTCHAVREVPRGQRHGIDGIIMTNFKSPECTLADVNVICECGNKAGREDC